MDNLALAFPSESGQVGYIHRIAALLVVEIREQGFEQLGTWIIFDRVIELVSDGQIVSRVTREVPTGGPCALCFFRKTGAISALARAPQLVLTRSHNLPFTTFQKERVKLLS